MKGMLRVVAVVLAFAAGQAAIAADKVLVCERYGFTNKAENFHSIKTEKKRSVFKVEDSYVLLDGVKYDTVNPGWVGLDGLAITYHTDHDNRVLYLYVNEVGEREVGISAIESDSDTIFRDKAVYQDCNFEEEVADAPSEQVLRTSQRGNVDPLQVYVF